MQKASLVYINPMRSAITLSLVVFLLGIPVTGLFEFFRVFDPTPSPKHDFEWLVWVLLPAIGAIVAFIAASLAALAFNLVSRITGGIPYAARLASEGN